MSRETKHLAQIMNERDSQYRQRFDAQEKAVAAALAAAKEAVVKAETASDRRFENTNEWRATVNDILKRNEGRGSGLQTGWTWLVAAGGLFVAFASLALTLYLGIKP